jgi:hypothetical protein
MRSRGASQISLHFLLSHERAIPDRARGGKIQKAGVVVVTQCPKEKTNHNEEAFFERDKKNGCF